MAAGAPKTVGRVRPGPVQRGTPFWRAPWDFAVHGIVGTAIFATIAAFAVALDMSVRWLAVLNISLGVILGLKTAEYAVLVADLCLFGVFLWRNVKRAIENL